MAHETMSAGGHVTLPEEVRAAAGLRPGDRITFGVTERGAVELRVLSRLSLAEALARYRFDGPVDDASDRPTWRAEAALDAVKRQPS